MTFEDTLKDTREQHSLALASWDSMVAEKNQASADIDFICNSVMGTDGILEFYVTLFKLVWYSCTDSTFMGISVSGADKASNAFPSTFNTSNFRSLLVDTIGKSTSLFSGGDNDFNINLNSPILLSMFTGNYRSSITSLSLTGVRTNITTNYASSGATEKDYRYTTTDKNNITNVYNAVAPIGRDVGSANISSLQNDTVNHLISVLGGSASTYNVPSLSTVITHLNTCKNNWTTFLNAYNSIKNISTYTGASSYNTTLYAGLNSMISALSALQTGTKSLLSAVNSVFQKAGSSSAVTGFRKQWVYWLLKLINRPSSYRMTYVGASQAESSLKKQADDAAYTISLIATDNLYLSTPDLYSVYFDLDLNQYVAVFSALPCFKQVELQIGSSTKSFNADSVIDNSEVRFTASVTANTTFKIRLKRDSYYSDWSDTVKLSQ